MQPNPLPLDPGPGSPAPGNPTFSTTEPDLLNQLDAMRAMVRLAGGREALASPEVRSLLNRAIASLDAYFLMLDNDLNVVYINPSAASQHNATPEDLVGATLFDLFPDANTSPAYVQAWEAIQKHEDRIFELYDAFYDRWYETRVIADEGITFFSVDITARKRANDALRETNAALLRTQNAYEEALVRLRLATSAGNIGIWDWDQVTGEVYCDDSTYAIMGLKPPSGFDGPVGFDWRAMIHPEDVPKVDAAIEAAVAAEEPFFCIYRIIQPDGAIRYVKSNSRLIFGDDGTLLRMIGVITDVTQEQQEAERQHQEEESLRRINAELAQARAEAEELMERLKLATSTASIGVWDWDLTTDRVEWDDNVHRIFGHELPQPGGEPPSAFDWLRFVRQGNAAIDPAQGSVLTPALISELIHPDDREHNTAAMNAGIAGGEPFGYTYRIVLPSGDVRHVKITASPMRNATGQTVRVIGVVMDVTLEMEEDERQRREEERLREANTALERSQAAIAELAERLSLATLAGGIGTWDWDRVNDLTYWDAQHYRICGFEPPADLSAPIPFTFFSLVHPDDQARLAATIEAGVPSGKPFFDVFRIVQPSGAIRWVKSDASAFLDAEGRPVRMIGAITDVTLEMEATERQRREEERLREANTALERSQAAIASLVERLRLANIAGGIGTWEVDRINRQVFWDKGMWELFGRTPPDNLDAPLPFNYLDLIHPEDQERVMVEVRAWRVGENPGPMVYRILRPDGAVRWARSAAHIMASTSGEVERVIGTSVDVTLEMEEMERQRREEERLRAANAAITELMERLSLATNAGGIGIWEEDLANHRNYWDEQTHRIFGTPIPSDPSAPLAFDWFSFVHPDDRPRFGRTRPTTVVESATFVPVYRIIRPDGAVRWVKSSATVLRDDDGQRLRVIGVIVDVTLEQEEDERQRREEQALRQLNAELEQRVAERTAALTEANRQLEYSARIKDEFMATMSHELRTPFTTILGAIDVLAEQVHGDLNPQQGRFVGMIRESSDHLLQLINAILDFSRVQSGTLDLDLQRVPADLVYRPALRLMRDRAAQKELAFTVTCTPNPLDIVADPQRLKQMLTNLLDNAVKFTPAGGQVGLDITGDAAAGVVRFTVWDTGIGVDAANQPRLFQAFSQVDSGFNRAYQGIGLGLALTQRLAALHNGSVTVESTPGEGSRFTIELPWEPEPTPLSRPLAGPIDLVHQLGRKAVVLLVEDNPDSAFVITDLLEQGGCAVTLAQRGEDAVRLAAELRPDIILMDIELPGMNGLEATRTIRALPDATLARTPIIALTAYTDAEDRRRCLAAGMNDHVSKPVHLRTLLDAIQQQLRAEA